MRFEVFIAFLLARPFGMLEHRFRAELIGDPQRLGEATAIKTLSPVSALELAQRGPITREVCAYIRRVEPLRHDSP